MSKKTFFILTALAVVLAVAFTVLTFIREVKNPPLPVLGQVGNFVLTDANGEDFPLKRLEGKAWVADFFFTTCGDICPVMSQNMASLSRSFEQLDGLKFVSITVNPEFDSPEKLKAYAEQFVKGKNNWYFLTGSRDTIKKLLVEDFKLGDINEPIFHSPHFTLMDNKGFIRGYYDGTSKQDIQKLFKDASRLIAK